MQVLLPFVGTASSVSSGGLYGELHFAFCLCGTLHACARTSPLNRIRARAMHMCIRCHYHLVARTVGRVDCRGSRSVRFLLDPIGLRMLLASGCAQTPHQRY
jgi:hypothetical protein